MQQDPALTFAHSQEPAIASAVGNMHSAKVDPSRALNVFNNCTFSGPGITNQGPAI